jgi:hypothetical protein
MANFLLGNINQDDVLDAAYGVLPAYDDGINGWDGFQAILQSGVTSGQTFSRPLVSTWTTTNSVSAGGVLGIDGYIHLGPVNNTTRTRINIVTGVVSTWTSNISLVSGYFGGVLAPNGDIYWIPGTSTVGCKMTASGVFSTYSLIYTTVGVGSAAAYTGGVLAPNGDIHFVPGVAPVGQKISTVTGVVSTYTLLSSNPSASNFYWFFGGALAPNGDIHFVPTNSSVGQKISTAGVVSTYTLVNTAGTYRGGVLSPNGDIHFIPYGAPVGQKISAAGVVSTYTLAYTIGSGYQGGVLAPNGDIHFVPNGATVGQKISAAGIVSTYTLGPGVAPANTNDRMGGVFTPNGDVYFLCGTGSTSPGIIHLRLHGQYGREFGIGICASPYLNKL